MVPLLHQRASLWYEAHDLADEAVRHALAAQDFDRAAFLMEIAVPAIRRDRREATLLAWLEELPDDVVRRSPVLGVFSGYMLMASGDLDAFGPRLDEAERLLAAAPAGSDPRWAQTEELRTLPATIAVYRASLAQARGDLAGTAEHARRALALAGPDDHLARGGAAGFLALVAWAQGDVSSALETFTPAVASLHASDNLVDELTSTVVLADMWLAAGRPSEARRLYQRALQVGETHGGPALRALPDLHVGLSELEYERGDLAAARGHLEAAKALGDAAAMTERRYRWFVAMARITGADGDHEEAIGLLDTAERLYRPGFFPDLRPDRGDQGARLDLPWPTVGGCRLGPRTRRVRHGRGHVPARVRPPDTGAVDHRAPPGAARTPTRSRPRCTCWHGCTTPPTPRGVPEASSRSGCCPLWLTRQTGIGCRRSTRCSGPGPGHPSPTAYVRLFLDEGEPMRAAPARSRRLTASPASTHVACSASARPRDARGTDVAPRRPRSS